MALPRPVFESAPEPFAAPWLETECDPSPKPGVLLFRDFVVAHQGGGRGLIGRDCGGAAPSGHYSGRAWDWMISALDDAERAPADELIAWLLANDAELFRRAGLRYIIWDRKVWSSLHGKWQPYGGYDAQGRCPVTPCRNPHTDHVHFSFGIAGADGTTSFYDWLRGGMPTGHGGPRPLPTRPSAWGIGAGLAGFVMGFVGARRILRRGLRSWL